MSHSHLAHLNEAQKKAATHKDGPLLIIAGAGTGKTNTLTHRILHLIKEGVDPSEILAITFTNKAAKEMNDRVSRLLETHGFNAGIRAGDARPFIGTFHALGVYLLRAHAEHFGLTKHFSILDKRDAVALIKEALKEEGLDPKQYPPEKIAHTISRQKGNLMTLEVYREEVGNSYFPMIVARVWGKYEALLRREKALDFDDLLLKTVLLLRDNEDIRTHYQNRWKYVHIDEYQDTNAVQYELARLLAGTTKNICAVGDGDQTIYTWRGADVRNILNFEKDYGGAEVIVLEENYRSTKTILAAANNIIKKNNARREKNLYTENDSGELIGVIEGYDEGGEARKIGDTIRELIKTGVSPEDIAVLYRANFQSRALEEAFLLKEIPYQVLGVRFFERKEVKDILCFIRAALNPDSLSDIKRIIDVPPRGIGKATLAKMFAHDEESLAPAAKKRVLEFRNILAEIKDVALTKKTSDLIKFVLKRSGLEDVLKSGTDEDLERLENIHELVTLATKYDFLPPDEAVEKLLADAALASDQDSLIKNEQAVKLMTVHAAKGLEFEYVFVTGLEQDLFPHRRMQAGESTPEESEEERRLCYVAITRAKKKLFLSYASVRMIFGQRQVNAPSEFLSDIDDDLMEHVGGDTMGEEDGEAVIRISW